MRRAAGAALAAGLLACVKATSEPSVVQVRPARAKVSEAPGSGALPLAAPRGGPDAGTEPRDDACRAACNGTPTAALRSEITSRAPAVRRCYNRLLARAGVAEGRIVVRVRVQAGDTACGARVTDDDGAFDAAFADCVKQAFLPPFSEAPADGCVDVAMPFRFVMAAPDAGPG